MLVYATICFLVAALGGLVLASFVLRGRLAPWALSLLHAALGATGLGLTLVAVLNGAADASTALIILVVAALGGFFLASFHLRGVPGPKPVVVLHALIAVTGFALLANAAFALV